MLKFILLWFPMLVLAILNGGAREWYKKFLTESLARQFSTLSLLIFFSLYIWGVIQSFPPKSTHQAIYVGILWLCLTLIFEFGFGRFRGNSWNQLFSEYNFFNGKLWILIPLWVAVAPYIIFRSIHG